MSRSTMLGFVIVGIGGLTFLSGTGAQDVAPIEAPDLTVRFTRLRSTRGVLRVTLFDATKDGKGFPGDTKYARETRVVELGSIGAEKSKETTITFTGLTMGSYAVAAFHDENNNNKMDTHWYGKPKEGSGASNDPRPKMRAPRWSEAKFEVPKTGKNLSIALWYP